MKKIRQALRQLGKLGTIYSLLRCASGFCPLEALVNTNEAVMEGALVESEA